MSLRDQLTRIEAKLDRVLNLSADYDCPQGCKCAFCTTFELGVNAGREDAEIAMRQALSTIVDRGEA